jgi:hypothetical protein
MLDDCSRGRIAAWLRATLGPWSSARHLAELADVALEPVVGVPDGVAVRARVVYFDPSGGAALTAHRLALGVSAALLADFLATFTLADIAPLAAVLLAAP